MSVKQLSVFAENKNGSLFEITKILRDADIDISAFSIADTQSYGVLRLIVCDPKKAAAALSAENKIVNVTEVVGVQIPDTKGGLNELLDVIASENISVDYLYAFVSSIAGKAYVVLRVENNELTEKLLKRYGFTLLTDEDIAG
ncbi:MAG: ACT domain-containing protein [Ruminococcaceae bacterium]|nr:ACT domain-containing protein [Oscillospiraceae bacterium]